MAIRLEHQPLAISGVAAYATGLGKSRDRQSKRTLDILREQQQYKFRQGLENQRRQFQLGVEGRRNAFTLDRDAMRDRAALDRIELSDELMGKREEDRADRMDARERKGTEYRMWSYLDDETRGAIDDIHKSSGGHFRGPFADTWNKMQEEIRTIMEDKNPDITPAERLHAIVIARQDALNQFDPMRDVTPYNEVPGALYPEDGVIMRRSPDPNEMPRPMWFKDEDAAREHIRKHTVDGYTFDFTSGGIKMQPPSKTGVDPLKRLNEAVKELQAEEQEKYSAAVGAGSATPAEPRSTFSDEEIVERANAMDARDAKRLRMYGGEADTPPAAPGAAPATPAAESPAAAAPDSGAADFFASSTGGRLASAGPAEVPPASTPPTTPAEGAAAESPEARALEDAVRRMEAGPSGSPGVARGGRPVKGGYLQSGAQQREMQAKENLQGSGFSIDDYVKANRVMRRLKQQYPTAERIEDLPADDARMLQEAIRIRDLARGQR